MVLCLMAVQFPLLAQTPLILPLGNSITQADQTHYSYRFPLWQKLRNVNAKFDFIGTMNTNYGGNPAFPDPAFDKDHEGHRGWRADQLLASLPSWLANYTPDIVLVHAGTNDMFMGNSVAGTVEELKNIIDVLRADNPDVAILLAKIIGTTAPENARIVQLNSYIDGIAAEKNTARSRVIVVDQYTGFNPTTDAYDGKHPNAAGEEKMAQKWFNALMTIMDVQPPTIPQNLVASAITQNSFTLSWSPSSDNKGVTRYEVFRNGSPIGTTSQTSFQLSGLSPATVYSMTVAAGDGAENWSPQSNILKVTTANGSSSQGTGLTAEYYNTTDLSGAIVLKRIDPQVNFSLRYGSPAPGVSTDNFSARWTGSIQAPVSANFTFSTVSDDGVRLWVNNVLVVNNWTDHGSVTNNSDPVALTAGVRYNIRMEYYEKGGAAVASLLWSYPGQAQQVIPQTRLYPSDSAGDTKPPTTPTSLSPSNITETGFILSWTASTDNQSVVGYEVFLNGTSNGLVSSTMKMITGLAPGSVYSATVRARDAAGNWSPQSIALSVKTAAGSIGAGTGLSGSYFNTIDLTGWPVLNRVEPKVDFSWGYASPASAVNPNDFSARWTGSVEAPVSGSFTFSTVSDDGVRLWVNDVLMINNWTNHGSTTNNSQAVALVSGVRYNIRMEYYEKGGAAVARLLWTYPGQSQQAIPQGRLYPSSSAGDTQPPTMPTALSASNVLQNAFTLTWAPSADNQSVTGYEVFLNGNSLGTASGTTRNISGLLAGTLYTSAVRARDAAGNWSAQSSALNVRTISASTGRGSGLSGAYYNTIDLSGPVVLNRVENVDFDWRYSSPGAPVNIDNFSVRWTGWVEPPVSSDYTFSTVSDDGVRLWVNNALVIDNWTDHGSTTNNSSFVALNAGVRYAIRMEYYEKGGAAVVRLQWAYPGKIRQAIPVSQLYPEAAGLSAARTAAAIQSVLEEDIEPAGKEEVPGQLHSVAVYPNPAKAEGIRIALYSDVQETSEVSVVPAHGARALQLRKTLSEGYNVIEVPTYSLPDGVYVVVIASRSRRLFTKFVVHR